MLCPFWGRNRRPDQSWPDYADRLIETGREFLELTEIEQADIGVFPQAWKQLQEDAGGIARVRAFDEAARASGKPRVYFLEGNVVVPVPLEGAIVMHTSLLRSRRLPTEFALPHFHDDLLNYSHGELQVRRKRPRALVSFCGAVLRKQPPQTPRQRLRRVAGGGRRSALRLLGRPDPDDLYVRANALDALLGQDEVETDVIVRDEPGGGAWTTPFDASLWEKVRRDYVRSIVESDYVLCARGANNTSWRFYETLSLGRIPVFVDTDCVLPYDFLLPWRDYCVWIDRSDLENIGERVATFHEGLSEDEFVELQRECRRLWEEYLSPHGFFSNFYRHLS